MKMKRIKQVLLICCFAVITTHPAVAAELGPVKSNDRGVTVEATPRNVAQNAKTWQFKIVLDSHTQDLSDDLAKSATLLGTDGVQYAPVSWEGAAPGGHHREGVLNFKPLSPHPPAIELRIQRADEAVPRTFRWALR
jgi:hypothetical protein